MNDVAFRLPAGETPARFTIDELMEFVASDVFKAGEKLELVDGLIVGTSPAQSTHMLLQRQIFRMFDAIFGDGRDGYVAHFDLTLQFGKATLRDADLAVVKAFDTSVRFPDPATVLLIVEISQSTLEKDLNSKRIEYAGAGIPHYWVVDPDAKRVHIMSTITDGDYAERRLAAFGESIPVPGTDEAIAVG